MSEITRSCETCKRSKIIVDSPYCLCSAKGVVLKTHCCKKYEIDWIKIPPRKKRRTTNTSRFSPEDFSID